MKITKTEFNKLSAQQQEIWTRYNKQFNRILKNELKDIQNIKLVKIQEIEESEIEELKLNIYLFYRKYFRHLDIQQKLQNILNVLKDPKTVYLKIELKDETIYRSMEDFIYDI